MSDIYARLDSFVPMNSGSVNEKQFITADVIKIGSKIVGSIRSSEAYVSASVSAKKRPSIVGNLNLAGPKSPSETPSVTDHALLTGRDKADQHPIEAIIGLRQSLDEMGSALELKADGMEVDAKGLVYLLSGNERIAGPFGPFGTGSGGSTNAAKLTVTNTTGWLFTTVADGRPCMVSLNWSSLLDGISTGKGQLQVYVAESLKTTLSIEQGDISVDASGWLTSGSNSVRLAVTDAYGNVQSLIFTIEVVSLILKSTFDGSPAYSGDISYYYVPVGAAQKTVHFLLDGEEIGTEVVTVSNQQQDFIIPAQPHGSHTFEVYFTARIGDTDVESDSLYYDLICTEEGNTIPIIASTFQAESVEQFDTFVVPYRVYDPLHLTASVILAEDGKPVHDLTVDRTEQQWSHRLDTVGQSELTITCGDVVKRISVSVTASTVAVSPVTNNLVLDLSSYGRSNLEPNPLSWDSNGISCRFSGFNLKSDGWCMDNDGVTVMRVGGDARLTIPMKLFEKDARTTGKTIELEFATRAVRNYEATIVSCMDGGRGLEVTSQMAAMASAQSSINTQYKEDEHIRLSFVIEKRTGTKLMMVYLNGICSGAVAYPDSDDFMQNNAVEISIGSSECTIDLYHIRVYNSDLTRQQILLNWIADTQLGAMKKARFARNDVYDDYGNIVIDKLPKDLPYLVLTGVKLPQFKGDKCLVSGYYVDPVHPERSFRFVDAEIDVQGTSSQYYRVKNYKLKFKNGFILADGTVVSTYAMSDDAIPVMVFCMKADVASSEGANNVVSAKIFNTLSPKMPAQEADPRVRNTIDGHPIVIFWDSGSGPVFLGKYNFNNDKSTNEVFGLVDGDESWECKQNGTRGTAMKEANFEGDAWEQDWEARFPDGNKDTTRLNAFVSWVASTNSEEATNATLNPSVTYGGTTHTRDTPEFRLDKFRYEIDQLAHKKQGIAYYLFTLVILAIDQREKNTFPTYIARVMLWFWLYYDGDSILGINNKGALAFSPFLEDTDFTEAGDPVFNGAAHVFWTNIRLCFGDEIEAMYQEWRTQGLLSFEIMRDAFDEHQSKWPEAIFNEDMFKKCLEAWIEDGDGSYLPMLLGKKELQRAWWLFFRFRYLDSKFVTGSSMENRIIIRAHEQFPMKLIAYVPIYGNVFYNSLRVSIRMLNTGEEYEFPWDASGAEDAVIGINDADLLTSLGDLSGLMVETIDLSKATHLTYLKLGDGTEGYENKNLLSLTLGNNTLLKWADIRNCPNLTQSVDMSGCTGLEEVYFDGTSITGLSLPNGGALKKLHLPESVVNLTLRNQTALTEFVMPSYRNVSTLWIENVSPVVDPLEILSQIPANSRVRLIGVHMAVESYQEIVDIIARLDTMRGIDENNLNVATAQVSGTIYLEEVTQPQLNEIALWQSRYPSLAVLYSRVETYTVRFWSDGVLLETVSNVKWGASVEYSGDVPVRPETESAVWEFTEWLPAPGNVTADMDCYAQFRNTIPLIRLLVEGTYAGVDGEFRDDTITSMAEYALASCPNLRRIVVKELKTPSKILASNTLDLAYAPSVSSSTFGGFGSTTGGGFTEKLVLRDYTLTHQSFDYIREIPHLILEGSHVIQANSAVTNVRNIYVRSELLEDYKKATNWADVADKIHAIEDYPEIWRIGEYDGPDIVRSEVFDDEVASAYLTGTLTEVIDSHIKSIKGNALGGQKILTKVVTPNAVRVGEAAFPASLEFLDVNGSAGFGAWSLSSGIKTFIIRSDSVPNLHGWAGLSSTPIARGEGYIYVPASIVDSYKSATNWSAYADQIRAIEDYPEITGDSL